MVSSTLLTLLVIPAIWSLVKEREVQREWRGEVATASRPVSGLPAPSTT